VSSWDINRGASDANSSARRKSASIWTYAPARIDERRSSKNEVISSVGPVGDGLSPFRSSETRISTTNRIPVTRRATRLITS
jgi:hypothetical protein